MKRKPFGGTGINVSEIGMGTYYDPLWLVSAFLGWRRGASRKIAALRAGIDAGINLIDTAEIYSSEPLVAKAIKGYKREELFIATKVWPNHLHRDELVRALEKSLKRMELSYVDLYQIHFPNPRVPLSETMSAMEEMKEKGKILNIGVSNFSLERVVTANAVLRKSQIVSCQVSYNLADRSVESDLIPYCEKEKIAILAYYPLGHGKLASARAKMDSLSNKYSKTPSQIAINWLASKEIVFPIPRASNPEHVRENLHAGGWEMQEEDRLELEKVFSK